MIGIIGAMDVEISGLRERMSERQDERISGVRYTRGRLFGQEAVLAVCGVGKCFATLCAQTMILRYQPACILNIGVAGTLSEHLGIGDVAVGTSAVCHDMDTSPLGDPVGLISGIHLVHIPLDEKLSEGLYRACEALGIKAEKGVVASGDQFICNRAKKEWIEQQFSAIVCEMEGQAIAQTCFLNGVPCAILRSVSDNADGTAGEYEHFKHQAAANSEKILEKFFKQAAGDPDIVPFRADPAE